MVSEVLSDNLVVGRGEYDACPDVAGKLVTTLANGEQKSGCYDLTPGRQNARFGAFPAASTSAG